MCKEANTLMYSQATKKIYFEVYSYSDIESSYIGGVEPVGHRPPTAGYLNLGGCGGREAVPTSKRLIKIVHHTNEAQGVGEGSDPFLTKKTTRRVGRGVP